ncbi:MAG TPA: glycoside hydrolase family 30 beta sandwich domain-containing protein [Candidatus Hydrogenedentes bacterium]|nr:glycoside hydrolase family 30 beta sandwich domain-containing protein [Candidatus Hydrogenedentota bacterium]
MRQTGLRIAAMAATVLLWVSMAPAADRVEKWLTTPDLKAALSRQDGPKLEPARKTKLSVIEINPSARYQEILGMGASFDHASCENLTKLSPEARAEAMIRLFDPDKGIGINLMRLCIGASDFIGEPYYTYCDLPEGEKDPEMTRFSIEKDRAYVLPLIKEALRINPSLKFFASPWSPPAWMKDTGRLEGGRLLPEFYPAFAKYLARFIQAYEAEGIPIYAITVQNEPRMNDPNYPTCVWTGEEQRDFIRDHLGPLFRELNLTTRVWCWDHNWNLPEFPIAVLSDPAAAQYVDGTAFHLYEGRVETQSKIREMFPDKHIYFSEGSVFGARGAVKLASILQNWARSYNFWVVLLDEHRKPNRGPHSASATCVELLDDGSLRWNYDYYMYGQFMKFILPGAVRIGVSGPEARTIGYVAARNPDGALVMVVANAGREPWEFAVTHGNRQFRDTLPAGAVATYRWQE